MPIPASDHPRGDGDAEWTDEFITNAQLVAW